MESTSLHLLVSSFSLQGTLESSPLFARNRRTFSYSTIYTISHKRAFFCSLSVLFCNPFRQKTKGKTKWMKNECRGSNKRGTLEIYIGNILLCVIQPEALKIQVNTLYANYYTELLKWVYFC